MTVPTWRRVRAFDRRHPLYWDLAPALALVVIALGTVPAPGPFGLVLLTVVCGAVVFRRRRPLTALLVVVCAIVSTAAVVPFTGLHQPWIYPAGWVVLFNAGLRGDRRTLTVGAAIGVVALAALVAPADGTAVESAERLRSALTVTAMCVASSLLGAQIDGHRRSLAAQREEAARTAVVAERSRIAQEMHDIIGHNLSVITSLANGGAATARSDPEEAARAFQMIGEVSRSSVREVRRVLAVLRHDQSAQGAALTPQPGLAEVAELVESVRGAGRRVRLERSGDLDDLSAGRQLAVYRIVQESLTNTLRHANEPAQVDVRIGREDAEIVVEVADRAAPPVDNQSGFGPGQGILGMRERAEAYGGRLDAHATGTGWVVRARIPTGTHENRGQHPWRRPS